ncbi:hypothetical protein SK128_019715, partial [Halocaridina rubra]
QEKKSLNKFNGQKFTPLGSRNPGSNPGKAINEANNVSIIWPGHSPHRVGPAIELKVRAMCKDTM